MKISAQGISLIQEFEGFRLEAYDDGVGVITIGIGCTVNEQGKKWQLGDRISKGRAYQLFERDIAKFENAVNQYVLVPLAQGIFDALVSFAFNVGVDAFKHSTLLRLLNDKQYYPACQQLDRWINAGTSTEAGLRRRRDAEQVLFIQGIESLKQASESANVGNMLVAAVMPPMLNTEIISLHNVARYYQGLPHQILALQHLQKSLVNPVHWHFARKYRNSQDGSEIFLVEVMQYYKGVSHQIEALQYLQNNIDSKALEEFAKQWRSPSKLEVGILAVPYFSQRDNVDDPTRTCFSSAVAMAVKYIKPSAIASDDEYITRRSQYGGTTQAQSHLDAVRSYGLVPEFIQTADFDILDSELAAGRPVPFGYLHHGSEDAPSGSGHWAIVIGKYEGGYVCHDPWGVCDRWGIFNNINGGFVNYSRRFFEKRWTVEGDRTGWVLTVRK